MKTRKSAKWMEIASSFAALSRCDRRKVGAVILDTHNRVVATGYNGAPAHYELDSGTNCSQWCPRAQMDTNTAEYDTCPAVHAEMNALLYADRTRCDGGTIIVDSAPCINCAKAISNSGIRTVICAVDWINDAHRKPDVAITFMRNSGLDIHIMDVTA